jgi:hypothetical protein
LSGAEFEDTQRQDAVRSTNNPPEQDALVTHRESVRKKL